MSARWWHDGAQLRPSGVRFTFPAVSDLLSRARVSGQIQCDPLPHAGATKRTLAPNLQLPAARPAHRVSARHHDGIHIGREAHLTARLALLFGDALVGYAQRGPLCREVGFESEPIGAQVQHAGAEGGLGLAQGGQAGAPE